MGQRKEIVTTFVSQGLPVYRAIKIAGIKKSTYYYRSNGRPIGKRPSTHTFNGNRLLVPNHKVVNEIIDIISPEYHDYGYQVVTHQLRRKGYIINPKKVYRLMKEHKLLHPKIVRGNRLNKVFIKHTVPPLEGPFFTVEADIKYIYLHEQNRNAFLITFLCTFCRYAAVWELSYSMRSNQIIDLVKDFISHPVVRENIDYKKVNVKIRTDNGPQFIAKNLAKALDKLKINHEFINPGTPQENGHIESFHSTVTRLVCKRNIFKDLNHAISIFQEFFSAYNNTRVMKSLLHHSPIEIIKLWKIGVIGIKKDKYGKEIFFLNEKPVYNIKTGSIFKVLTKSNKINTLDYSLLNLQEISPVL